MEYSDSMLRSCITVKVERYCLVMDRMHTFLDVSPDGNVVESKNCSNVTTVLTVKTSILNVYTYIYIYILPKKQNILEYMTRIGRPYHQNKTGILKLSHGRFRVGKSSISVLSIMLGKTKRYN